MQGRFAVPGCLQNFNTENSFKGLDKSEALKQVPPTQCQYICSRGTTAGQFPFEVQSPFETVVCIQLHTKQDCSCV